MSTDLKKIIATEANSAVQLYPKRGIALARGEGSYVLDTNEKKYLDFMTNLGVNILGYSKPSVTSAVAKQLETLPSTHQTFYSPPRADFLDELKSIFPQALSKVIFTNSGAESVEVALKLAMAATGKSGFIAVSNAYHGKSLGSLSLTAQESYKTNFLPFISKEVLRIPFNDIDATKKNISGSTAAVIVEPIQGEAGVILPGENYLSELKELCQSRGILLIFDEVQSAIRTGSWLASEQYGVVPDIACFSKSFSYGIPFGFVVAMKEIGDKLSKGGHGSTFAANPLACVAAAQVIRQIKTQQLLENAKRMGNYFLEELKNIQDPVILEIKGRGLMIGIALKDPTTPYLKKLQDMGLIAASSSSNTIRFLPPINVSKTEIDEALKIIKEVFSDV